MEAEPDASLGYEKNRKGNVQTSNKRNGHSPKTLKSRYGEFQIDVPRDREGGFEPKLIPKYQRDISGMELSAEMVSKNVNYSDLKKFSCDFKSVYHAPNETAVLSELEKVKEKWGKKYPYAISNWENNWEDVSSFFQFSDDIRRIMYTTNIIEGLNRQYRKVTKIKSAFPSDSALEKMCYLVSGNVIKNLSYFIAPSTTSIRPTSIFLSRTPPPPQNITFVIPIALN